MMHSCIRFLCFNFVSSKVIPAATNAFPHETNMPFAVAASVLLSRTASTQRMDKRLQVAKELPTVGHSVPRVAKLLALAIRFEGLISDGVVASYAELARLGRVTQARLTQLMNLLNLAPDIQEEILFLAQSPGRERITERNVRCVASRHGVLKRHRPWN